MQHHTASWDRARISRASWLQQTSFILPTIYDPFSNACLEALAAGLPVITTSANGFAEIMTPGIHGTVVDDPSDCSALVSALLEWKDVNRRESTRSARVARAAEFPMECNLAETLKVISRLKETP
jgi:UDP-glucose:(heptosyl)LPS alpha-1,3-glucosyltransferase